MYTSYLIRFSEIFLVVVLFFLVALSFPLITAAQDWEYVDTEMTDIVYEETVELPVIRVATVNVYDPIVVSRDDRTFEVSYTAHNREGVQTDIRSRITFTGEANTVVYAVRDEEVFTLGVDESVNKTHTIHAPAHLSGDFEVHVLLATQSAFPLANVLAGTVSVTGNGEYVSVHNCFLSISDDPGQYVLMQGVDVAPEEMLTLMCEAENLSQIQLQVTPRFSEFWRSPFGNQTGTYTRSVISFEPGEKKEIMLGIQKSEEPQSYTQLLTLSDASGNPLSNLIELHYVVRGVSATIQNVLFDKPSYLPGEDASVTINWSGAADSFLQPRHAGTTEFSGTAVMQMFDATRNVACSEPHRIPFDMTTGADFVHERVVMRVNNECFEPGIRISIADDVGNTLDERSVTTGVIQTPPPAPKKDTSSLALVALLAILCVLVLVLVLRKRHQATNVACLLFVAGMGIAYSPSVVNADTFVFSPHGRTYTIIANHDRASYAPNANAVVTTSISAVTCYNGWNAIQGDLHIIEPISKRINLWSKWDFSSGADSRCVITSGSGVHTHFLCDTGSVSDNFNVSGTVGSHEARYRINLLYFASGFKQSVGSFTLPYTVFSSTNPSALIHASDCDISSGGSSCSTTVSWSSSNTTAPRGISQNVEPPFHEAENNSTGVDRTLTYGTHTFTFHHAGGTQIASRSATASCIAGTSWDGTTCLPNALYSLTVNVFGNGSVTSNPSGISCEPTCVESFPSHQPVRLTATPGPGHTFVGWSGGGCIGTGNCDIIVTDDENVTARFSGSIKPQ